MHYWAGLCYGKTDNVTIHYHVLNPSGDLKAFSISVMMYRQLSDKNKKKSSLWHLVLSVLASPTPPPPALFLEDFAALSEEKLYPGHFPPSPSWHFMYQSLPPFLSASLAPLPSSLPLFTQGLNDKKISMIITKTKSYYNYDLWLFLITKYIYSSIHAIRSQQMGCWQVSGQNKKR